MDSVEGQGTPRVGRREASVIYDDERRRAGRRPTFVLLRQERHWSATRPQTDGQMVRLKAVRAELAARHVRLPPRSHLW